MFATRISEFHDFLCYYVGICMYEDFIEKDYWKHPEEVVILTDKAGNNTIGSNMLLSFFLSNVKIFRNFRKKISDI